MSRTSSSKMLSEASRQSPRLPLHLRTALSDNTLRVPRDRAPKPDDQRRHVRASSLIEKKRGMDLESRLGNAEEELRKLKAQLEAATGNNNSKVEESEGSSAVEDEKKSDNAEEMLELETRLWKTERELLACQSENADLRRRLAEAEAERATWRVREGELLSKLEGMEGEIRRLDGQVEEAKAQTDAEIGKLRVQMEQWRKAANVAAAIVCSDDADSGEDGRRRSSVGKRVLGELWKRKGHGISTSNKFGVV